jgi:hypothetical protein
MKLSIPIVLSAGLLFGMAFGMASPQTADPCQLRPNPPVSASADQRNPANAGADDVQQLSADVQRLKILLNQMRTNLAFVQTTQSPLKHQFELEADAWQVVLEQMERRLKRMEDRKR